jgi:hypothetical protein
MRWFCVGLILAGYASGEVGAQQQAAVELAPSSNWVLDYDDDSCALRRSFGAEDEKVVFELRQFAPGADFDVTVAGMDWHTTTGKLLVRFEPDTEYFQPNIAWPGVMGDNMRGYIYGDSLETAAEKNSRRAAPDSHVRQWDDPQREARETAITGLRVSSGLDGEVFLKTGSMREPMNAMRDCLDELLTHWGIDASAHKTLSRDAIPIHRERWVARLTQAYPADMLQSHQTAQLRIRLTVAADGKVSDCHLQLATPHPSFEKSACSTLRSAARFEPALDASGQPIASYFVTSLNYLGSR